MRSRKGGEHYDSEWDRYEARGDAEHEADARYRLDSRYKVGVKEGGRYGERGKKRGSLLYGVKFLQPYSKNLMPPKSSHVEKKGTLEVAPYSDKVGIIFFDKAKERVF